jgi:hypothetical protein
MDRTTALPPLAVSLLLPFAPLFSKRVWGHGTVLIVGALLAPARRTITAARQVLGLGEVRQFPRYHRVLRRAQWSGLAVGRTLLELLATTFAPGGTLVFGIDETLERRRGAKIAAKGIYRDAVRSSHSHFVKASGLRWICLMLLVPIPWAKRTWALPVLTALAPSERYDAERQQRHKTLADWARQLLLVVRHWCPERPMVVVADRSYAVLPLLAACRAVANPIVFITRLRLDAALYEPAPPRRPHQMGRPRVKGRRLPTPASVAADPATEWTPITVNQWYGSGERTVEVASATAVWYHVGHPVVPLRWVLIRDPQGTFQTQALLCTDTTAEPTQILRWFVQRWQLEVTCEEARRHLGGETQRQWSDRAIVRTTPVLLGLFSLVTLLADQRLRRDTPPPRQTAWYRKAHPTFIDALALVRRELWAHQTFSTSAAGSELVKVPRALVEQLTETLCYAA